ncbi:hypothetical protein EYF80_057997 [Liparis tanakae]|uniref:Secreted protein n=1 Tax=Liparis tanakae TaxID=230148 RepID=A0A4Z2ESM4_9TELE|nr:hypothetical protein EYF80_057997 [Liparis tanakae]
MTAKLPAACLAALAGLSAGSTVVQDGGRNEALLGTQGREHCDYFSVAFYYRSGPRDRSSAAPPIAHGQTGKKNSKCKKDAPDLHAWERYASR